jgi:PAS domain S-box-containing protein
VVAFGVGYYLLCRLGDELHADGADFALFWPASGAFLAVLLLSATAAWPWLAAAVVVGELVSGLVFDRPVTMALAFGLSDVVEAGLAALLLRRAWGDQAGGIRTLPGLARLVAVGAGLGAGLGALVGTLAHIVFPDRPAQFLPTWLQWWAADAMGVLLVAPAVLAWVGRPLPARGATLRGAPEAAALALVTGAAALLTFGPAGVVHLERGYLLVPLLGWAAASFGLRGVSTLGAALAFLSSWAVSRAAEGDAVGPLTGTTLQIQLLLAVSVGAALILASVLDEREVAEARRRESEALFDAFRAHSPAALFILDARARLITASRSFERMMGRPMAELIGTRPRDLMPDAQGDAVAEEIDRVLARGDPVRADRHLSGRVHDVVKFRIDREGREPLVGAVAVDVTEQRQALRSLRLAQVALDRNFTAILFVEPSGLVTYANEAAGRLFERPFAELPGRSVWELDGALEEASWPEAWGRLRAQGALVLEGRLVGRGGRRIEAEVGLTFVAVEGQQYAVYAARDLTERRQAESAQRLAAVGTLAAGMAHEINNPLTFVAANLAFAIDRVGALRGDPRADEAARALEDAEEGTRRVARVVRDLKAVSRVDAEERHPVDLRAEVETALKLAQNELRHRATVQEALDEVPRVEASEFQLGQVFLNLLVNAAHALGDGDPASQLVRVATRTAPDGWAVVEVSDSGAGIPAEVLPRIFEPFFTTKPLGKGTGLGLSVCHGIVTGLGGRIEVESQPGRGSTFRVLLPPAAPAGPPAPAAARPRPEGARARILVVDDEQLIGSTIRRLLSTHEVVALTDPRQALARLCGGEHFDLILCDLMMPQLSGMELHQQLARARPEAARRMVFMTGGAFTDRAREFLEQVGNPQLGKPFAPQDLRDSVRGWLVALR